jgi:AcrR family transcriptional regulator
MAATASDDPRDEVDPRVTRSRTRLLAAATELLVDDGIRAVTVEAVAERSGVAKSTLYRHWGSARELLLDVLCANMPEPATVDLAGGFDAALRAWMDRSVSSLQAPDWPRTLVALLELGNHAPEMAELLTTNFETQLSELRLILELGAAEGAVPDGLDPRQVTYTLAGPLVLAAVSGDGDRVAALADAVLTTFLASHRPDRAAAPLGAT